MSPILKLKKADEKRERAFELKYLSSLPYQKRLRMMLEQNASVLRRLIGGGYRKPFEIIKHA